MNGLRIAHLDLETAPLEGYAWGIRKDDQIFHVTRESFILSFSVRWNDEKKIRTYALPDYRGYRKHRFDDRALAKDLRKVMDSADIIVAQNGDAFDVKVANTSFIVNKLPPPSPYKTVDTLKALQRVFNFPSNKLDYVCQRLKIGQKVKHEGKDLWVKCIAGDLKAWERMKKYNAYDVELCYQLFQRLKPWMPTLPNIYFLDPRGSCPRPSCGSALLIKRGSYYTRAGRQVFNYQCKECGGFTTAPAPKT